MIYHILCMPLYFIAGLFAGAVTENAMTLQLQDFFKSAPSAIHGTLPESAEYAVNQSGLKQ